LTTKLHSKFSVRHVIVEPIIIILLVCFLSTVITFASINMVDEKTSILTPIWTIVIFLLLLFWSFRYYLKTFKQYIFFDKGLEVKNIFGKKFYSWQSVKEISIIETELEKILWQYLQEDALCITLKNGTTLTLYSKYYSNMPKIRQLLNSKNQLNIINSYNELSARTNKIHFNKKTFKGIFILSFDGIFALFIISIFGIGLLIKWESITTIGFLFFWVFPALILFILGLKSYYFQLNQNYLIVKNNIFLNLKKRINLEKVKVIYFEQKLKKEPSIRIIDENYNIKSFQGASLKNKHWKSLILNLKNRGIVIVDYMLYEYNE